MVVPTESNGIMRTSNNRRISMDSDIDSQSTEIGERSKRQIYYLCGSFPNQYLSLYPCNNNCNTCGTCRYQCSTSSYCQQIQSNWRCLNNCCQMISNDPTLPPIVPPITTTTPATIPSPICGGRETSGGYCRSDGTCGTGYLCTDNYVCCRCSYGTSIGPCVNQQCPNNTYCSPTNNCCPYLVSGH